MTSDHSATLWYWIACIVFGMAKTGSKALGMIAYVGVIDFLMACFRFLAFAQSKKNPISDPNKVRSQLKND